MKALLAFTLTIAFATQANAFDPTRFDNVPRLDQFDPARFGSPLTAPKGTRVVPPIIRIHREVPAIKVNAPEKQNYDMWDLMNLTMDT